MTGIDLVTLEHDKPAIDITPEMIEAGVRELIGFDENSSLRETVHRILRAALVTRTSR